MSPMWTVSTIQPPRKGPMTEEIPQTPPKRPLIFPRSLGGKRSAIVARATGKIAPPPSP